MSASNVRPSDRNPAITGELATPAEELLAEKLALHPEDDLILFGCGTGAGAAAISRKIPYGRMRYTDISLASLNAAAEALQLVGYANSVAFHPLDPPGEVFARAAVSLPKGRGAARRWLLQAFDALHAGGECYLAGANNGGVQSAQSDAQALFGNAAPLAYRKGSRLVRAVKSNAPPPLPAWAVEPGIAPGSWLEFDAAIGAQSIRLRTLPGVFAVHGVDEGTALLLEHLSLPEGSRVLDFGCGCGVIGLWAALHGAAQVDLLDVNLLAVAAAAENITRLGLANATAIPSDILQAVAGKRYDAIVSNPPFHTGLAVDYSVTEAFLTGARAALNPGGQVAIVANRFIRYERFLQAHFPVVRVLAETGKFRVLQASL